MEVITCSERIQLAASRELKDAIEAAARRRRMSLSDYARCAIADSLRRDGAAFPDMSLHVKLGLPTPTSVRMRASVR
jgi:hypothetical protein